MSPPSIRGLLVSLKEATIVLGILLGFLIGEHSQIRATLTNIIVIVIVLAVSGYLFSSLNGGWAYTFAVAIIPAIVMFLGAQFVLRESTRFLYLMDRKEEAKVN
jgi:MFS family permease